MVKRQTAKDILAESFKELAEKKDIDKITIKEITDNCGYSQATFYRQFKDKYDLIAWDYERGIEEIMDRIDDNGYTWRQSLSDAADYYERGKNYLANLMLHTSGHDAFILYMNEINFNALEKHILKVSGEEVLVEATRMYIRLYCFGTVSLTCEWVLGRYEAAAVELAEVFEKSLPEPLKPYLS